MSTQAIKHAIGLMKSGEFDGARLKVLMYLAWKHDWSSGFAWPSMATIATETGIEERSVRRVMHYLEEHQVIRIQRGNGAGHITRYEFPALAQPPLVADKKGDMISEKGGHSEPQRGTFATEKGDRGEPAIRKEKQDQKQEQKQTQNQNHHADGASPVVFSRAEQFRNEAQLAEQDGDGRYAAELRLMARELETEVGSREPGVSPVTFWIRFKESLRAEITAEEWDLWLRPAYLLREAGGHLLLALPVSRQIQDAYFRRQEWLREKLRAHGYSCSATKYPDEYTLDRVRREFPEQFENYTPALREKAKATG